MSGEIAPGLHLVSVPIGRARDITLTALDVLAGAEVLAAEDTRSLRRLLDIHGVALKGRSVLAYHDANGARMRPRLLAELAEGRSVAYASEAGTPLVADPGFALVREALAQGVPVTAAPGPVAAIAALTLSGLPSDRFYFAGFAGSSRAARRRSLSALVAVPGTLVFYESPRRLSAFLDDAAEILGRERPAALCRELTKKFEEVRRDTLGNLAASAGEVRGECVVCIGAPEAAPTADMDAVRADLRAALGQMRLKDAARDVAARHGLPAREVYRMGLED